MSFLTWNIGDIVILFSERVTSGERKVRWKGDKLVLGYYLNSGISNCRWLFGCSKTGSVFTEKGLARDKNFEATVIIRIICDPFQDGRKSEQ